MAHQLFQLPRGTALSSNLTLVAGAKVEFFLTETTTPTPVYQDSDLSTPHANPVIADAAGRLPPIYLDPLIVYKIEFRDSADVEIYPAVDPVNDQFLSQAIIGAYLHPRTQAEIDAGVTPVNYFISPGDPKGSVLRYGNNTTPGTTDMSAALQAALNVKGLVTLPPNSVIKINSGVTMDAATTTLDGQGCGIKSGLSTAGTVISVNSSLGSEAVARNGLRNFILYADAVIAGVTGINFEQSAAAYVAGLNVDRVAIQYFAVGVRIYSNAFNINFNGCMITQSTIGVYIPSGGDNYGEKITFNHCFLGNNTRCIHTIYEACQVHLVNCSLDYSNEVVRTEAGWVTFDACYVENNLDTDRWFIASGVNARIIFRGGEISVAGAKTSFPLAYAIAGGQIDFEGVVLYSSTNDVGGDFIGDAADSSSYILATDCKIGGFLNSIYAWAGGSVNQSMCSNGAFTTNINGWTTGSNTGGGGGFPTRNATAGSTGGPALEMYVSAVGHDQNIYWEIPAEPGDIVGAAFSCKSENVSSSVGWQIQLLGNDNTVVGTSDNIPGTTSFNAANPAADTNWHARRVTMARSPKGTTKARLVFSSDYEGGFKAWIESVSMCKY